MISIYCKFTDLQINKIRNQLKEFKYVLQMFYFFFIMVTILGTGYWAGKYSAGAHLGPPRVAGKGKHSGKPQGRTGGAN